MIFISEKIVSFSVRPSTMTGLLKGCGVAGADDAVSRTQGKPDAVVDLKTKLRAEFPAKNTCCTTSERYARAEYDRYPGRRMRARYVCCAKTRLSSAAIFHQRLFVVFFFFFPRRFIPQQSTDPGRFSYLNIYIHIFPPGRLRVARRSCAFRIFNGRRPFYVKIIRGFRNRFRIVNRVR